MADGKRNGWGTRARERFRRMARGAGEVPTTEDLLLLAEQRQRVGRVINARWVLLGLLAAYGVFVALLLRRSPVDAGGVAPSHGVIAVAALVFGAAYNAWYQYSYRWFVRFRSLNQAQILFDILVVTAVVHYSGGAVSWFWAMYAVLTLEAALLLDLKGDTYAMAVLCSLAYGGLLTVEYYGLVTPVRVPFENSALQKTFSYEMMRWGWVLVSNLCVAFVGDYMMESVRRRQETLRRLAVRDPLLPLYSRRYFYYRLNSEIQRAKRYGRTVSLLIMDVDDFKRFNDRLGHLAGDALLRTLAELILSNIRRKDRDPSYEVDIACRYGGDEFALILPEAASHQGAAAAERLRANVETKWAIVVAERIRRQVENIQWEGAGVTVSVGVASYPEHGADMDGLVKAADDALYAAKRAGRNRVIVAGSAAAPAAPEERNRE